MRPFRLTDEVGYLPMFLKAIDVPRSNELWKRRGVIRRTGAVFVKVEWQDEPGKYVTMNSANLARQR